MPTTGACMAANRHMEGRRDRGAWARRHNHALVSLARRVWQDGCTLETAIAMICETAAETLEVERVNTEGAGCRLTGHGREIVDSEHPDTPRGQISRVRACPGDDGQSAGGDELVQSEQGRRGTAGEDRRRRQDGIRGGRGERLRKAAGLHDALGARNRQAMRSHAAGDQRPSAGEHVWHPLESSEGESVDGTQPRFGQGGRDVGHQGSRDVG